MNYYCQWPLIGQITFLGVSNGDLNIYINCDWVEGIFQVVEIEAFAMEAGLVFLQAMQDLAV